MSSTPNTKTCLDLFPALGLPQQFIGEKVGIINYFLDSANLLDDDGTLLRAVKSDDGFEGVTDATFVAVNDVNTQIDQILLWMKRSRQQLPLNDSCLEHLYSSHT